MENSTMTIIVSVVAIVLAAVAMWQARKVGTPVTGELVQTVLQESTTMATELTEAALTGARAAEQLYRTGKIQRDARLTKALNYVRQFFPDMNDDTLITAIESAVLVVNSVVDAMPKPDKRDAPDKPLHLGR